VADSGEERRREWVQVKCKDKAILRPRASGLRWSRHGEFRRQSKAQRWQQEEGKEGDGRGFESTMMGQRAGE
jgi:hypothetical protein